jgi:PAS domain S-box-containing protein
LTSSGVSTTTGDTGCEIEASQDLAEAFMPSTIPDSEPGHLIDVKSGEPGGRAEGPAAEILLFPAIVVGLCAMFVAVASALAGWHRDLMLLIAAGVGGLLLVPAMVLLFRMRRQSGAIERQLQGAQARVGGIVESAMDAIITIDTAQRIVHFNAAAEAAFRWPRRAVIGEPIEMLIPDRFRAVHRAHVERFASTAVTSRGMGAQTVLFGLRADGTEFPIEASISQHEEGGVKLLTVILRDITRRMESEQQLMRGESRLRGILDSAMDAIITVDDRQHIVLFNAAAETVFRCPREQAMGAPLDWFIPARFREGHRDLVLRFGESVETSRRMGHARVVMGLRRDGEEFPIEASISHTAEDGQKFYTVILRDVTERVRAETALKRSQEEIQSLALAASTAREQEKSRIARELHDELGQQLTALKIDLGWLRQNGGRESPERVAKIESMQHLLDSTVASARRISADLRPPHARRPRVGAACEWLAQNFTQRTGIPCELVMGKGEPRPPGSPRHHGLSGVQEDLTNARALACDRSRSPWSAKARLHLAHRERQRNRFAPQAEPSPAPWPAGLRERALHLGGTAAITARRARARASSCASPRRRTLPHDPVVLADDHTIVREGLKGCSRPPGDLTSWARRGRARGDGARAQPRLSTCAARHVDAGDAAESS